MINGIKPTMTKTTELRVKPTSFDEAMESFCTKLEENCKPYVDRFNHMDSVTFKVDGGSKYIKVKYFTTNNGKEDIKTLLNLWYSEQIPPDHWIELLKENGDLRAEYNKERKRRENNG